MERKGMTLKWHSVGRISVGERFYVPHPLIQTAMVPSLTLGLLETLAVILKDATCILGQQALSSICHVPDTGLGAFTNCFRLVHRSNVLTQKAEKAVLWRFKMKVYDLIMNIVWIIILLKKALQDYIMRNMIQALHQLLKLWKTLLIFRALTL